MWCESKMLSPKAIVLAYQINMHQRDLQHDLVLVAFIESAPVMNQ